MNWLHTHREKEREREGGFDRKVAAGIKVREREERRGHDEPPPPISARVCVYVCERIRQITPSEDNYVTLSLNNRPRIARSPERLLIDRLSAASI